MVCVVATGCVTGGKHAALERVRVASGGDGFILEKSGQPFVPWGFNYDHDGGGRLIEDYWDAEWWRVEEDFREMRELGANVVRVHLQFGKFMQSASKADAHSLHQLQRLLDLAEREQLRLDITGLGCYHKRDVPAWYDTLSETDRWRAQACFWDAIARQCAGRPVVFCFDLMNEPVVPGAESAQDNWLGPPFAGKHFVQFVTRDRKGRLSTEVARAWTDSLVTAIRRRDRRTLVTIGLVSWSLDRPGWRSGFVPDAISGPLDFFCVHLYPEKDGLDADLETLRGFRVGKPVLIEETFPLHAGISEFATFIERSRGLAAGWIGFYWGRTIEECRRSLDLGDRLTAEWLEFFQKRGREMHPSDPSP